MNDPLDLTRLPRVALNLIDLHPEMGGIRNQLITLIDTWCEHLDATRLVAFGRPGNPELQRILLRHPGMIFSPATRPVQIGRQASLFDVAFFPFANFPDIGCSKPAVTFIPDTQESFLPQNFRRADILNRAAIYARVRRASAQVITPSAFSRDCLVKLHGIKPDNVHVVPHSIGPGRTEHRPVGPAWLLTRNFVFYPAINWPHKNHESLLIALARLRENSVFIPCALCGARLANGIDIDALIRRHGLEDQVVHLGQVSDEEVAWLYANAQLLVFPSRFEGFGLPVLEALSCGTPVACSGATSLPEIAPRHTRFFDPMHPDEIAFTIADMWCAPPVREGRADLSQFAPERSVRAVAGVFARAALSKTAMHALPRPAWLERGIAKLSLLRPNLPRQAASLLQKSIRHPAPWNVPLSTRLATLPDADDDSPGQDSPLLSIITQGRDDGYMGNFLWRLSTCLEKQARNIRSLGAEAEVELLLCDYGGPRRLIDSLCLTPETRALIRIVRVPATLAAACDRESPYSFPHAVNTAIRRARGRHVLFVDSDTYTPTATLAGVLTSLREDRIGPYSTKTCFFLSSRRHIPAEFHRRGPSVEEVDAYAAANHDQLPHDKISLADFAGTATAYLMTREMWHECRGFDERMIHWGWFDIDLYRRLSRRYQLVDMEDQGLEFYHLEHYSDSKQRNLQVENPRPVNQPREITSLRTNSPLWGLHRARDIEDDLIPIKPSAPQVPATSSAKTVRLPTPEEPVHFFTIVLNGMPFLRHHIDMMARLPFRWTWHIVEGAAELKHDTAWSLADGGILDEAFHREGLSLDGTTEYLDELATRHPQKVIVHRKPRGVLWAGKTEMTNAPLASIHEAGLLWQIDADELWSVEQVVRTRELFAAFPTRTSAHFYCSFHITAHHIISKGQAYANNPAYEWRRVWRFMPGDRWVSHEPPKLCRGRQGLDIDLSVVDPIPHATTQASGLVFTHYAYATESQVAFKERYYGYAGAVAGWKGLCAREGPSVNISDHLPWVARFAPQVMASRLEENGRDYRPARLVAGQWRFFPSENEWLKNQDA